MFVRTDISKEEVARILDIYRDQLISVGATQAGSKFNVMAPVKMPKTSQKTSIRRTATRRTSAQRTRTDQSLLFQFTLRTLPPAKGNKTGTYYVGLFECLSASICKAKEEADKASAANTSNWPLLPYDAAGVSQVFYGKTDDDDLTDILVLLSNGTGMLFKGEFSSS